MISKCFDLLLDAIEKEGINLEDIYLIIDKKYDSRRKYLQFYLVGKRLDNNEIVFWTDATKFCKLIKEA